MPKLPTTDRFRIICEAEAQEMGLIVAQLTRMGLTNVHFELITDVIGYRQNAKHEVKAEDFLAEWIKDHATFRAAEAVQHFRDNGRTDGAGYTALRMLCEKKILNKISGGNYSRADVKAIEAGKHTKTEKTEKKTEPKTFSKSAEHVILSFARRNHGRFSTTRLIPAFEKEGRARGSVYASINKLLTNKLAKRVGDAGSGEYVLTAKATPKPQEVKAAPLPNGKHVEVEAQEVVTNG
jgi:hypothetical protein